MKKTNHRRIRGVKKAGLYSIKLLFGAKAKVRKSGPFRTKCALITQKIHLDLTIIFAFRLK